MGDIIPRKCWHWILCGSQFLLHYKQICLDAILILPASKYVRKLASAVRDDLKLTEPAQNYLKASFSKLDNADHQLTLLMDEVYCKKNSSVF